MLPRSLLPERFRFTGPRNSSGSTVGEATLKRRVVTHAERQRSRSKPPFTTGWDVGSAMNLFQLILIEVASLSVSVSAGNSQNLTCYQCIKDSSEECGPEYLLPCPKVADRCVTHISKHVDKGYQIKRECGLGPCQFEDDMANKGLGMGGCDRSKEEYFCVFCCRTDGCNKSDAPRTTGNVPVVASMTLSILLGICYGF